MKTSWNILSCPLVVILLVAAASFFMLTGANAGQMSQRPMSIAAQTPPASNPQQHQPSGLMIPEITGAIAASVAKADDPKGLTIRSEPSLSGRGVAFLALGAMLKGPTAYRDGWVRVDHPQYPGWVSLANMKPIDGAAAITAVDRPENCLRIRNGPSSSFQVVECARLSDKLALSGFWSDNNWALLQGKGWVYGAQIHAPSKPVGFASVVAPMTGSRLSVPGEDVYVREFVPSYYYYRPYWSYWPGSLYWSDGHRRYHHFKGHRMSSGYKVYSAGHGGSGRRR
jgi:hypothetical protein